MNRIYKTIYNYTRKCIIVCNELTTRRKANNPSKGSIVLLGAVLLGLTSTPALSKVTIAGVYNDESTDQDQGLHQFFGADSGGFRLGTNGFIEEESSAPNSHSAVINLPTYKKNTYYFGAGKDFNGAFTDFQNNDSVLFISSMSGQKTSKGENIIYVSYTALQKTSDGKIVHRVVRQEKITCTYGDPNCLNFEGKLSGGLPRDMAKIQDLVPKLQPFLKGPSGSNYNDKELRPGSFNTSLRLTGVADGEISATSFDAVNGKQIWQLKQELGTASEYISVNATDGVASPITSAKAQGARATAVGENAVASGSNSLAIGHNASTTETATNSVALGAGSIANAADVVSVGSNTIKRRITNLADGVSATDAATVGQIGKVASSSAKEAVVVANGTNTTVTLDNAGGKNTYKVNVVADGKIASGNTGIVTGDTVHKKFEEFTQTTNTQLSGFAKIDGSNIDIDNGQWLTKLGSRSTNPIAEGNKHFVTGEQIAQETRVVVPGKFITGGVTTVAQNLHNLDDAITDVIMKKASKTDLEDAFNFDHNTTNAKKVQNEARKAVSVTSDDSLIQVNHGEGDQVGHYTLSIHKGSVAQGTAGVGLITGEQIFNEVRPTNGTYIQNTQTTAQNLNALDANLKQTSDTLKNKVNASDVGNLIDVVGQGSVTENKVNASDVGNLIDVVGQGSVTVANATVDPQTNKKTFTVSVKEGSVANNDQGLVSGHKVHEALNKQSESFKLTFADKNLSNITETAKTNIRNTIQFADNGDFIKVNFDKNSGVIKVDTVSTGKETSLGDTANNNRLVTSATLDAVLKTKNGELEQTISQSYAKTDASNIVADKWLDKLGSKADAISTTNTHFVTGAQIASETRLHNDGKYVKATNSAAGNLDLLDKQLFANTEALQTKVNKTEVSSLAQEAVKVTAAEHVSIKQTTAPNNSSVSYEIGVATDNKISEGGKGLVTSGTVYDYVKDFTTGQGYATTTGSNIVVDGNSEWFTKLGTANGTTAISQGNTHFVSGKEVFDEVRVKNDGNSIKQANTVAQNFDALDKALANKIDKGTLDNELGQAIQNTVSVESKDPLIKVEKNGNAKYQLSLKTTESKDLAETENALVTRNTLKTQLSEAEKATQTKLDTKADLDASNLQPDHVTKWQTKLGNGTVAADNQGLVTGKTVYDEVRVKANGTYVEQAKSAGENITALDTKLQKAREDLYGNTDTGKTVYDEVRVKANGTYVEQAKSAGENITALDTKLQKAREDLYGNTDTTTQTLQLAKTDLSNLTTVSEPGMMAIGKSLKFVDNDNFVKIGFDEQTKSFKVEVSSTGTEEAKTALASGKPNRLVTTTTLNSALEQKKGEIEGVIAGNYAKIDASNIQDKAWLQKLGTQDKVASISEANDHFVTGKEVYKEVRPTGTLHYTATNMTTGENLAALDGKLNEARKALYGDTDNTTPTLQLAKSDLSNLTALSEQGKLTISKSLTFNQGDFVNITFDETKKGFTLQVNSTGDATSLDTSKNSLVTSTTLNSVLTANKDEIVGSVAKDFAKVDASNITTDAWHTALGATAIDGTNKGFVSAKQVYDWGNPGVGQFNVIQGGKSVGENLVLIDKTLGEHATSIESLKTQAGSKPNFSVANNGLLELKKDEKGNYILDIKQGDVTNSPDGKGAGVVTGEKVQTALDDLNTKIDTNIQTSINQKLEGDEFKQLVNNAVDQTIINQKVDEAMKNLVTDKITENDNQAVTSGAVHNALYSDSVHFGKFSESKGQYSTAVGYNSKVNANTENDNQAVTSGAVHNALYSDSVHFGKFSESKGQYSTAVGYNSKVNANTAGAFGVDNSIATGADNSYVVGMNNKLEASAKDTFVLGSGVNTGASNAVILGAGSTGVDNAVSVGSKTNKRKVVNVADGLVAAGSSEAVTGGQLYETQQAIANNQRSINQVANTLHKEINRAAANSAAIAALQPIGLDDEHHWSAAAGVGHYSGEQAVAVGLFYKPTQNFMVNMGGSTTVHGDPMVNLGVSYRFGAPYTNDAMTTGELQQKVVALNNQNLALEAQLESARSREDNMVKRVEKSKQELEALRAEIEQMKELLGLKAKMMKTSAKH